MSNEKIDLLKEQWRLAAELHRHEDNLTWQKFSYFVILTGGVFALASSLIGEIVINPNKIQILYLSVSLCTGSIISGVFFMILRRGLAYQKRWLGDAKDSETKLSELSGENGIELTLYSTGSLYKWYKKHSQEKLPFGACIGAQDLMAGLVVLTTLFLVFCSIASCFLLVIPSIPFIPPIPVPTPTP